MKEKQMNILKSALLLPVLLCLGFLPARAYDPNKPFIYEMRIAFETDKWINMYSTATVLSKSDNSVAFQVVANSTTTPTYQLVVTTQGNVGIGTGTPSAKLEVNGSVSAGAVNASAFSVGGTAGWSGSLTTIVPVDSYTKLLLHADGTDGGTTFTDSAAGKIVTANGSVQVDVAQSKFGGASVLFDGDGDYLSLEDSDDWNLGTGDFTIDFWVNFSGIAAGQGFFNQFNENTGADSSFSANYQNNNLYFEAWVAGASWYKSFAFTPTTGIWYHVAYVRSGTDFYCFVNGTQVGTTQSMNGAIYDSAKNLQIGTLRYTGGLSSFLNGCLDEFRISKGVARWTSDFTPPTAAYGSAVKIYTFTNGIITGVSE